MSKRLTVILCLACSLLSGGVVAVSTILFLRSESAAVYPPEQPGPVRRRRAGRSFTRDGKGYGPGPAERRKPGGRPMAKVVIRDGKIVSVTPLTKEEIEAQRRAEAAKAGPRPKQPVGIVVRAQADGGVVGPKDSPEVKLEISNRSKETISVPLGEGKDGRLLPGGVLQVLVADASGRRIKLRPAALRRTAQWLNVQPDAKHSFTIRLDEWFEDFKPGGTRRSGKHEVVCCLHVPWEEVATLKLASKPQGVRWWGTLLSRKVELRFPDNARAGGEKF